MKEIIIQVKVKERTYKKLSKYGFYFEKNINDYLDSIADEIRTEETKLKESKSKPNNQA